MRSEKSVGIALVLVTGILVLLALVTLLFLQGNVLRGVGATTGLDQLSAKLAAGSALEYAAARLFENPLPADPRTRTMANARDDWTFRDTVGTDVGAALNPSYSRGEPWLDAGVAGLYEPGVDAWTDAEDVDGDGRFSAASGRLRGGSGPLARTFSLQIQEAPSLACINSGELGDPLGDHDLDGILNQDDTVATFTNPTIYTTDINGNGVSDWQDPEFRGNVHLKNFLDNLGAVVGLPTTPVDFGYVPNRLGEIEISDLGRIVISNRPRRGYRSVEELRPFLSPADFALVSPFLAAYGQIVPVAIARAEDDDEDAAITSAFFRDLMEKPENRYEFHARVDLNTAPLQVIQAMLRHLACGGGTFVRLQEGEADAIASAIAAARPYSSWQDLLRAIKGSEEVFMDDPFTAGAPDRQSLLKMDLILAQLMPDGYWRDPSQGVLNTLEVIRGSGPMTRQVTKASLAIGRNTMPYLPNGVKPLQWGMMSQGLQFPCRMTTEAVLTRRPAGLFTVLAEGRVRRGSGRAVAARARRGMDLEVGRALVLQGQQDFEQKGADLASWRYFGGEIEAVEPAERPLPPAPPSLQSYPRFSFKSPYTGLDNYTNRSLLDPPDSPSMEAASHFLRTIGGLQLAARHRPHTAPLGSPDPWQLSDASLTFPFNEDETPGPDTLYDPNEWRDNFLDPVARGVNPSANWGSNIMDGSYIYPDFHEGVFAGPTGPRVGNAGVQWTGPNDAAVCLFPLLRATHFDKSRMPNKLNAGSIIQGSIECLAPVAEATVGSGFINDFFVFPSGGLTLSYKEVDGNFDRYLSITMRPERGVAVSDFDDTFNEINPDTPGSWHHLAFLFDPLLTGVDPLENETGLRVFIDGVEDDSYKIQFPKPQAGEESYYPFEDSTPMQCRIDFPLDDLAFYANTTAADIQARADAERFERQGSYLSPIFAFTSQIGGSASIVGLEWDGFIPRRTRGTMTFSVEAYDGSGALLGTSPPVTWDGTAFPSQAFRLPACQQMRLVVSMETSQATDTLRDTPTLDEVRLYYAGRPRRLSFRN